MCFFDLWIFRDSNYLITDLYKKPTASNTFLRADSNHPLLLNILPYSQMCRLKRICRQVYYNKNRSYIKKKIYCRGYKVSQIQVAEQKIEIKSCSHLLMKTEKRRKVSLLYLLPKTLHVQSKLKRSFTNIGTYCNQMRDLHLFIIPLSWCLNVKEIWEII